jgi:uncharacterized protein (TIGR02611 family)
MTTHHPARVAKRAGVQVVGWLLVLLGLAAIVLPGPGLLLLFAGLAILSQQFSWAERRVEPVKGAAFKTAADSVKTRPRIAGTLIGGAVLIALGVLWGLRPPAPDAWPLRDSWWLVGGWATGSSLIISGLAVWGLLLYSIRRFRD